MTEAEDQDISLTASPGDVLVARGRIPYPGRILQGFRKRHRYEPEIEPYVSFQELRALLEFLELVVLTERIIVPVPVFSKRTEKIVSSKRHSLDFAVFRLTGDLDLDEEIIINKLAEAGVLYEAHIGVGDPTADDVVARLVPSSKFLQAKFSQYLSIGPTDAKTDRFAAAQMAFWYGTPLHLAEAASLARVPYALSHVDEHHLAGYERETLRARKAITELLLDRLNIGAKKEVEKLTDLGADMQFPDTPIASLIVRNASSPAGLIDSALQLRQEFADYRAHVCQIERDLTKEGVPIKVRLRRAQELEMLAKSLWPDQKYDIRTSVVGVSEAFLAIPEAVSNPTVQSFKSIAEKLLALPVERVIDIYRKRRIRLLLKAKKQFLDAPDLSGKLAQIFGVPQNVVERSRRLSNPQLTAKYAARHPEKAMRYYGKKP